jgi:NhaA family Na+:H+ antiporter
LVIALFYTQTINGTMLLVAAFLFCLLLLCNGAGIRQPVPYFLLGGLLWLALLHSGIHATLAGVLTALTVPAKPQCRPSYSIDRIVRLLKQFTQVRQPGTEIIGNDRAQNLLYSVERDLHNMSSPLQRLIHVLHPWSAFLVIPLFALVNSGIPIPFSDLLPALRHPVTLGIILGLVAGKAIGVFFSVWLLTLTGISSLPTGVRLPHVAGISLLAGIGFTMSIFIGELSFVGQDQLLLQAKTGILLASLGAGAGGYCWLFLTGTRSEPPGKNDSP